LDIKRYGPGPGLPDVFAKRRANRAMEGLKFHLVKSLVNLGFTGFFVFGVVV
jgi:hypothetical protein